MHPKCENLCLPKPKRVHFMSDDVSSGSHEVISGSMTSLLGHVTSISCELQCCRS